MSAKQILISTDDVTYHLLPGSSGEVARESAIVDDTIFSQTYKSGDVALISWGINANAVYKGYPGYKGVIRKPGTSTAVTGQAMTLVSGKTYQINDATRRIWNRSATLKVYDNGVDKTNELDNVDWLTGKVTFKNSYSVTGPVTCDVSYYPMLNLGKFSGFTLNMSQDPIRNTDIPTAQANGGYHTFSPGLKTVTVEVPAIYDAADDWPDILDNRSEFILELNPDGLGASAGSRALGFFKLASQKQSGNVGALEEEALTFHLSVPFTTPSTAFPFEWVHATSSPIPTAVRILLDRWASDQTVYVKYLPFGTTGWKGQGVIRNISMSGGLESVITFAASFQMNGAPTEI